jgi:antitoxin component YwqK of YwqJK toxin-antitoxin module
MLHREGDLPAVIKYYDNGNVKLEQWYCYNELHRGSHNIEDWYGRDRSRVNNLPAVIEYYQNGNIKSREWYIFGEYY